MADESGSNNVKFRLRAQTAKAEKRVEKLGAKIKKTFAKKHKTRVDLKVENEKRARAKIDQVSKDQDVKLKPKLDKSQKMKFRAEMRRLKQEGEFDEFKLDKQGRWQKKSGGMAKKSDVENRIIKRLFGDHKSLSKRSRAHIPGKYGRDVRGSSGQRGLVQQDTSSGFRSRTNTPSWGGSGRRREVSKQEKEAWRSGDHGLDEASVGARTFDVNKATMFEEKMRSIKKKTKKTKEEFDASEHHLGRMKEHSNTFFKNFRKYSPNIMMWWKVVALLLPMMIALKVQAMGVKMALQSIGAAGLGMVAGGLFGHGEAIEDSMDIAERRMNLLKRELHQTFRPILQEFAPISERFLSTIPGRLQPLADALTEITVFEGAFNRLVDDAIGYAAELVTFMSGKVEEFEQVGRRFLHILFTRGTGFIEWLTDTMTSEQDTMERMIDVFRTVIGVIWRVLLLFSQFVSSFNFVFNWVDKLTKGFSSKLLPALMITALAFYKVIVAVNTAREAMIAFSKVQLVKTIYAKIKALAAKIGVLNAVSAAYQKAAASAWLFWSAVTLGGAAIAGFTGHLAWQRLKPSTDDFGGGAGGPPMGGRGHGTSGGQAPTYNTNITIEGDASKKEVRRMEDTVLRISDEKDGRNASRGI